MSTISCFDLPDRRRRYDLEDPFFLEGYCWRLSEFKVRNTSSVVQIGEDYSEIFGARDLIVCNENGCMQKFTSLKHFEEHRFKCHIHKCSVCQKSMPSDRLLSLHISEIHDAYFFVLSKKKASFECLVEGCAVKSWSDADRREHLIKDHFYHPSYDFHDPKKHIRKYNKAKREELNKEKGLSLMKIDEIVEVSAGTNSGTICEVAAHVVKPPNRAQRRAAKFNQASLQSSLSAETTSLSLPMSNNSGKSSNVMEPKQLVPACHVMNPKDARQNNTFPIDSSDPAAVMNVCDDEDIGFITEQLKKSTIKVPSKISFGRRK
jgi:hypothetical protein